MEKTFKASGTFNAYYEAIHYLSEQGYSYGSMCRDMPIGIMKGDWSISKWKNLSKKDIKELDGRIVSDDFREGDVTVIIYDKTEL